MPVLPQASHNLESGMTQQQNDLNAANAMQEHEEMDCAEPSGSEKAVFSSSVQDSETETGSSASYKTAQAEDEPTGGEDGGAETVCATQIQSLENHRTTGGNQRSSTTTTEPADDDEEEEEEEELMVSVVGFNNHLNVNARAGQKQKTEN